VLFEPLVREGLTQYKMRRRTERLGKVAVYCSNETLDPGLGLACETETGRACTTARCGNALPMLFGRCCRCSANPRSSRREVEVERNEANIHES
jgi:hypothetical protein